MPSWPLLGAPWEGGGACVTLGVTVVLACLGKDVGGGLGRGVAQPVCCVVGARSWGTIRVVMCTSCCVRMHSRGATWCRAQPCVYATGVLFAASGFGSRDSSTHTLTSCVCVGEGGGGPRTSTVTATVRKDGEPPRDDRPVTSALLPDTVLVEVTVEVVVLVDRTPIADVLLRRRACASWAPWFPLTPPALSTSRCPPGATADPDARAGEEIGLVRPFGDGDRLGRDCTGWGTGTGPPRPRLDPAPREARPLPRVRAGGGDAAVFIWQPHTPCKQEQKQTSEGELGREEQDRQGRIGGVGHCT